MNLAIRFGFALVFAAVLAAGLWLLFLRTDETPAHDSAARTNVSKTRDRAPVAETSSAKSGTESGAIETVFVPATTASTTVAKPDEVAGPLAGMAGPAPKREGYGAIYGLVIDENGDPAPAANVTIELLHWEVWQAPSADTLRVVETTDADGRFEIAELPDGTYSVLAVKNDTVARAGATLMEWNREPEVILDLNPAGSISGHVNNAAGEPVAGAVITPWTRATPEQKDPRWEMAVRTSSTADGAFTLGPLPNDRWRIVVRANGYAPHLTEETTLGDGLEIVLATGSSVRGVVVHATTGDALAGVPVRIAPAAPDAPASHTQVVKSDAQGAFEAAHVLDGEYLVTVDACTYIEAGDVRPIPVKENVERDDIRLVVTEGGTVAGRVHDTESGQGLSDVKVHARRQSAWGQSAASATTDAAGQYRIVGLRDESLDITPERPQGYPATYQQGSVRISATPGAEIAGVDFALSRGLALRGRTVDRENQPIGRVSLTAWASGKSMAGRSRDDGTFEMHGFDAGGQVTLNAQKRGYAYQGEPNGITVGAQGIDGVVVVLVPEASISGVVLDSARKPVAAAGVSANTENNKWFGGNSTTYTDSRGRFRIGKLLAGRYQVQATGPGTPSSGIASMDLDLAEGEERTRVEIVLEPDNGKRITGRVVNADGEGIANANINSWSQSGSGNAHGLSDTSGYFTLVAASDGTYHLWVQHQDYAPQQQQVTTGAEITITLHKNAVVEGHVRDAKTGAPVGQFSISSMEGTHNQINAWMRNQGTRVVHPEGFFRLPQVQPGNATLVVEAAGYAPAFMVLQNVKSGDTLDDVVVAMTTGERLEGVVVDPSGHPLAGAQVFIGPPPDQWTRSNGGAAKTNDEGRFAIDNLGADVSQVSAYYVGYAPGTASIVAGATRQVEIRLVQSATVQGIVRVNGEPPGQCWVWCQPLESGGGGQNKQTDAEGRFVLDEMPGGTLQIHVSVTQDGVSRSMQKTVEVAPGHTADVSFDFSQATAVLEGTVQTPGGTTANCWLELKFVDAEETFNAQTGEGGAFRFQGLPTGSAVLTANVSGGNESWSQRSVNVDIVEGIVNQVTIEFSGGATISGRIAGLEGEPMRFAALLRGEHEITVVTPEVFSSLEGKIAATVQIAEDGGFSLQGIEPGTYTLVVIVFSEQPNGLEDLPKGRIATRIATLKEDEHLEVTLELPAG